VTALWAAVQKRKAGHNPKRLTMEFSGQRGEVQECLKFLGLHLLNAIITIIGSFYTCLRKAWLFSLI
jgi:hypothetical protein